MDASSYLSHAQCLVLIGLCTLLLTPGCEPQAIQIPNSYTFFDSEEGTFACEYPEGWDAKWGGKRGPRWAKFSSGPALIDIKATATGSLMSDAMGGRNADSAAPTPQDAPVHQVHLTYLREAKEKFNNYTELPGSPAVLDCRLGPARLSEFTASTSFGTKLHGYRGYDHRS